MNWININDKKPKPHQKVLISNGVFVAAASVDSAFYDDDRIYWDGCEHHGQEWDWDFLQSEITHWAELPKPPKRNKY